MSKKDNSKFWFQISSVSCNHIHPVLNECKSSPLCAFLPNFRNFLIFSILGYCCGFKEEKNGLLLLFGFNLNFMRLLLEKIQTLVKIEKQCNKRNKISLIRMFHKISI